MRRMKSASRSRLPSDFSALVRELSPHAIHDATDYRNTQEMIDRLTSVPRLSRGQREYLDTLTILMEAYENENESIDLGDLDPIDALTTLMADRDMNASDLGRLLGSRQLGARILRRE